MAYESGICTPWINAEDLDCFADDLDEEATALLELAVSASNEVLFALSGSQYTGECTTTIRPTACSCCGRQECEYPGRWSDVTSAIGLGYFPVKSIGTVTVDGNVVAPTAYALEENYWLVRKDGYHWPCQQHRGLPNTEYGTWTVDIVHGEDPPSMGIIANRAFACELFMGLTGDASCALPKNVINITRLGVSVAVTDLTQALANRRTGVYAVDLFLQTYNKEDLEDSFAIGVPTVHPTVLKEIP